MVNTGKDDAAAADDDDEYLTKSTNYKAPLYAIYFIFLSLHLSPYLSSKYSPQLPVLKQSL
jgi:dethiobiotin synthetase